MALNLSFGKVFQITIESAAPWETPNDIMIKNKTAIDELILEISKDGLNLEIHIKKRLNIE